jgi:hypothetical protein
VISYDWRAVSFIMDRCDIFIVCFLVCYVCFSYTITLFSLSNIAQVIIGPDAEMITRLTFVVRKLLFTVQCATRDAMRWKLESVDAVVYYAAAERCADLL